MKPKISVVILIILFLSFANFSYAGWQKLSGGGDSDYTQFFEPDSLKITNDGKWRIWELIDYKNPKLGKNGEIARSSKQYWEIDCKEYQIKLITGSWFTGQMSSGESLGTVRPGEYFYIQPGSIADGLAIPLCTPEKLSKPK